MKSIAFIKHILFMNPHIYCFIHIYMAYWIIGHSCASDSSPWYV